MTRKMRQAGSCTLRPCRRRSHQRCWIGLKLNSRSSRKPVSQLFLIVGDFIVVTNTALPAVGPVPPPVPIVTYLLEISNVDPIRTAGSSGSSTPSGQRRILTLILPTIRRADVIEYVRKNTAVIPYPRKSSPSARWARNPSCATWPRNGLSYGECDRLQDDSVRFENGFDEGAQAIAGIQGAYDTRRSRAS